MERFVNDMRNALARVPNASAPRRRRRRSRPSAVPVAAAAPAVALVRAPAPRRRRKPRANNSFSTSEGTLRLSKAELVSSVIKTNADGKGSGYFWIAPDQLPLLKNLTRSFERIRWESGSIFYKPAVGTTVGGLVAFGVDWDNSTIPTTRAAVAAFSPSKACAIWADTSAQPMVLPRSKLQGRLWYTPNTGETNSQTPGAVVWAVDGPANTTVGEFWFKYTVTLAGTRA